MFQVEKKILDNGLRILVVPMKNSEAVTIQILVGVGSKNEEKKMNGISHFLEHLFFKGTKNRPNPGDIDKEIDKIGADHNAATSHEATIFWIKSAVKNFDNILDIISDVVLNPLFKEEEIEKEKGVILQEISMYEDMPQRKVVDDLLWLTYGDQPAGRPLIGKNEIIKKIRRSDILKYQKENYSAKNTIIIISGGIDKRETMKKISQSFKNFKSGKIVNAQKTKITQKSSRIKIINKQTDQSHLIIGFPCFSMFDERRYAFNILSAVLGGNTSSRLFMEIRQKLGLAYYVGSWGWLQKDTGMLGIRAGVSHDNFKKTIQKISEILSAIREKGISKTELKDAKSFINGQMALSFETSDQVADFYGEQELFYNKIIQPEDILEKIEKISENDILRLSREILIPEKLNMAVIGSHKNTEDKQELFKKIFKI